MKNLLFDFAVIHNGGIQKNFNSNATKIYFLTMKSIEIFKYASLILNYKTAKFLIKILIRNTTPDTHISAGNFCETQCLFRS